jgi:hypothetical protein
VLATISPDEESRQHYERKFGSAAVVVILEGEIPDQTGVNVADGDGGILQRVSRLG